MEHDSLLGCFFCVNFGIFDEWRVKKKCMWSIYLYSSTLTTTVLLLLIIQGTHLESMVIYISVADENVMNDTMTCTICF